MKTAHLAFAVAITSLFSATAFAQSSAIEVQRNVNQQHRIEQGLQSGQLTTREGARLEREESHVEKMQSQALRDGSVTPREARRINTAQNRVSQDIRQEKHDGQQGDPNAPSARRMQTDVQRNINQQQRIEQGIRSGALTNREAGRLERGQASENRREARAGADGHLGPNEQRRIQMAENRQSRRIHHEKNDAQIRR